MCSRGVSSDGIDPSASVSKRLVLVTVTAALGFFLFGYDTAVINGAIDALADHYGLGSGLKEHR